MEMVNNLVILEITLLIWCIWQLTFNQYMSFYSYILIAFGGLDSKSFVMNWLCRIDLYF